MTERDDLISQGMAVLREEMRAGRRGGFNNLDIANLVDAGWRPPPSGDVVEQVALHLAKIYEAAEIPDAIDQFTGDARSLADAGLLRRDPEWFAEVRDALVEIAGIVSYRESDLSGLPEYVRSLQEGR